VFRKCESLVSPSKKDACSRFIVSKVGDANDDFFANTQCLLESKVGLLNLLKRPIQDHGVEGFASILGATAT